MVQHHKFIDIVHRLGEKGYELKGVYRRIQDRALFLAAYGKLYANAGATTQGTDPKDTVDGMSLNRIDTIIEQLHSGQYRWKPARRVYVPKANGKRRPIGIPSWSDKMLQEVIRMVLTAYYEPRFSPLSHGFRPGKGCHTALRQIHHSWKGTKWFIEGDIKGCFDNIDHNVLLNILARDIKDNRFLKLIRQMLRAGYMEDWRYQATYSGTPQGGIVSPILANIVLNELDNFVQTELFPRYIKGEGRRVNPAYQRLQGRIRYARRKGRREIVKELEQQRRQIPSGDPNDPTYRRLRYCRYADDFLLGYIGTHAEAKAIKEEIRAFLKSIELEMSEEKTLITHATTGKARFLGYDIHLAVDNNQMTVQDRGRTSYRRRALNMTPILAVPRDVARRWRTKYMKQGKPTNRPELLQCSDMEIVMTYGREFQGVVNYYSLAHNVAQSFYSVKHVFMESAVRTLANKHKTSRGKIYAKYKRRSNHGVKALIVEAKNPNNPDKPYQAKLGDKPIRVTLETIVNDKKQEFYLGRNELVRRLSANTCELCGSTERIEAHHVRRLADVKEKYQHRQSKPDWAKFMIARHRKTVIVCQKCHNNIHSGDYDRQRVNQG